MADYSFPVFVDNEGNRFIFPGLYSSDIDDSSVSFGYCLQIQIALGVERGKEDFEMSRDMGYAYVESEAISSGFAHGGEIVHLIGGPLFDEISQECGS